MILLAQPRPERETGQLEFVSQCMGGVVGRIVVSVNPRGAHWLRREYSANFSTSDGLLIGTWWPRLGINLLSWRG